MTFIAFGAAPILFVLALILEQKAVSIKEKNAATHTNTTTSPWAELAIGAFVAGGVAASAGLYLALIA